MLTYESRKPWRMITMLGATAVLGIADPFLSDVRRPIQQCFRSADGTFYFSYPSDFQVCTTGKIEPCIHSYMPVCQQDAIVCVVYPAKQFENTNFGTAAFQVREIHTEREMMTPDLCVTPNSTESSEWAEFEISAQHPAEKIGGVLFVHGTSGEGGMSHWSSVDIYRAFHQQKCYELSLSESGTDLDVYDPPKKPLTDSQQKEVDQGPLSDSARLQISKVAELFKEG